MADDENKKDDEIKEDLPAGRQGKEEKKEEEKKEEKKVEEKKVEEKKEDLPSGRPDGTPTGQISKKETPKAEEKKEKPKAEEKKKVEASPKLEKIISEVEKLTVLELADLVKALEDKFGVSASVAAAAPAPAANEDGGDDDAEEQTVFNVVIKSPGGSKIPVIKAIRELVPTMGLKDAKDLVDAAPKEVITQVDKTKAQEAKKKLEAAGAEVELK